MHYYTHFMSPTLFPPFYFCTISIIIRFLCYFHHFTSALFSLLHHFYCTICTILLLLHYFHHFTSALFPPFYFCTISTILLRHYFHHFTPTVLLPTFYFIILVLLHCKQSLYFSGILGHSPNTNIIVESKLRVGDVVFTFSHIERKDMPKGVHLQKESLYFQLNPSNYSKFITLSSD